MNALALDGHTRSKSSPVENVVIRLAEEADLLRIAAIDESVYLIEGAWSYDEFVDDYNSDSSYYLVAIIDDEIVGYAACCIEDDIGQLTMNTVLPEYRGRGIGTMLLEERLIWLDSKVKSIDLQTHLNNLIVQESYTKYGFIVMHTIDNYYGVGVDALEMRRTLLA